MSISRIIMVGVPLLLISSTALADSQDKEKKQGASEPEAPMEEPTALPPPRPPAPPEQTAPPQIEQPTSPPPVGTTQTTAAEAMQPQVQPKRSPAADRWSVEPLIGYGTANYNFGVGGRIGYTFEVPIYVGGTFMWHAGETNDFVSTNAFSQTKQNFYYPGGEVGYDFGLGEGVVMIRPYLGHAALMERARSTVNNVSVTDTNTQYAIYPGLTGRLNFPGAPAYVGADTRVLVPIDHGSVSYGAFFVAGLSM